MESMTYGAEFRRIDERAKQRPRTQWLILRLKTRGPFAVDVDLSICLSAFRSCRHCRIEGYKPCLSLSKQNKEAQLSLFVEEKTAEDIHNQSLKVADGFGLA
jgi:hypothetical protein